MSPATWRSGCLPLFFLSCNPHPFPGAPFSRQSCTVVILGCRPIIAICSSSFSHQPKPCTKITGQILEMQSSKRGRLKSGHSADAELMAGKGSPDGSSVLKVACPEWMNMGWASDSYSLSVSFYKLTWNVALVEPFPKTLSPQVVLQCPMCVLLYQAPQIGEGRRRKWEAEPVPGRGLEEGHSPPGGQGKGRSLPGPLP